MAKQSLMTRIKANSRNENSNQNITLVLMVEAIHHYREHNNWTPLATMVMARDGMRRKRIEALLDAAAGIRFKADAKHETGVRLRSKEVHDNLRGVELLTQYAESGVSYMSTAFESDEGLPAMLVKNDPKVRTVEEIMLAAVRKARKDQPDAATKARILAAVSAALEAEFKS